MLVDTESAAFRSRDVSCGRSRAKDSAEDQISLDTGMFDAYHRFKTDRFVVARFDLKWGSCLT